MHGNPIEENEEQVWGNNALNGYLMTKRIDHPKVKGFSVRNSQVMVQFYNEYNQQLQMGNDSLRIHRHPEKELSSLENSIYCWSIGK